MGFPILVRWHFYIDSGPSYLEEKQWDIGGKKGRHSVPKCHTLIISINPATTISITLIRRSKHEAEWQWQWILNFPKFIPWIKYPEECQRTCTSTRKSLTKSNLSPQNMKYHCHRTYPHLSCSKSLYIKHWCKCQLSLWTDDSLCKIFLDNISE